MHSSTNISDERLLKDCLAGRRSAQQQLYQRYYGSMLAVCMRYARDRDEATEILNDAFLKVFQQLANYQGTGALGGWIRKITLYTAIDFARSRTRYRQTIDFDVENEGDVSNLALENLGAAEILELVQELPPASRNIFSLYAIDGYTHPEIAKMLSISVGTSKWHLAQARKALQKLLCSANQMTG